MHHSLDICYNIAEKLKDPNKLSEIVKRNPSNGRFSRNEWPDFSLAWGISGIICFYAMMNLNFENEGWDAIAHEYLKLTKSYLESVEYLDASLFYGLAGISFTVHLCSEGETRYRNMLSKLDDLFIQQIETRFLSQLDYYLNPQVLVPSHYYNQANGLSGIIAYLLYRQNFRDLTKKCVEALVKVLSIPRIIDSHEAFPWLVNRQSIDYFELQEPFKNGFYQLKVAYGITGVLGILSQIALKGIKVDGLIELIAMLADWIISKQTVKNSLICWDPLSPIEGQSPVEPENLYNERTYWKIGTAEISRCLHLASKALKNSELEAHSQNIFFSHVCMFSDWRKSLDSSFSMGKAGFLSLVYQMGCETEKPTYFKLSKEIEENLKLDYSSSNAFGFQSIDFILKDKIEWIDSPGLYQGAVGTGLSLLEVQGRANMPWKQIFLFS